MYRTAVALIALVVAACSSSASGSSGGGSTTGTRDPNESTPVSGADCKAACEAKGTSCGASAGDVSLACGMVCGGGATREQLACLQTKSCEELAEASGIDSICPKSTAPTGSSSSSAALGDACKCAGVSTSGEGMCSRSGTAREICGGSLSCAYAAGSEGAGQCVGATCCDRASACDADPSLLKPCAQGTCKKIGSLTYYCAK